MKFCKVIKFTKNYYLKSCLLFLVFFSCLPSFSQIVINPTAALAINGTTTGGIYYNPFVGVSDFVYETTAADLAGFNTPSRVNRTVADYQINGAILSNCGSTGRCSTSSRIFLDVIPMTLTLSYLSNNINVNLAGVVGTRTITAAGRASSLTFFNDNLVSGLPWTADIEIKGYVNVNTPTNLPSGDYLGNFTIQVTIP